MWIRLLRGSGRSGWFEAGFPVVSALFITVVLLFILGLQQGFDHRSQRTAWRTAQPAEHATALQASYLDYVGGQPVTVVELAQLTPNRPDLPAVDDFPAPGELWVSPALKQRMGELPADQLAGRFGTEPTAELPPELLEFPEDLVAVVGRSRYDPAMREDRPPHQWHKVSSQSPVGIDGWSRTPDLYRGTYEDLMMIATVLLALPLLSLGGLAARLIASRRNRRLAIMRLVGGTASQVARLTVSEVASLVALGAATGVLVNLAVGPLLSRIVMRDGTWYDGDLRLGALRLLVVAAAVVALMAGGALLGLLPVVRDPLGVLRRQNPQATRAVGLLVAFVGMVVFWLRSGNVGLTIIFVALMVVGLIMLALGPLVVAALGRTLAVRARTPATLLAGRRLADDPRAGWRTVSGVVLAAFAAGFLAVGIPLGLGLVEDTWGTSNQLQVVVPTEESQGTTDQTTARLGTHGIRADIGPGELPLWLDEEEWAAIVIEVQGPDSERERARTAIADLIPGQAAVSPADDNLPNVWIVRDATVLAVVVLAISVLVAVTSMVVGAVARILDQRGTLTSLRLAGTPLEVLESAQRREMLLPTLVLGCVALAAGMATGLVAGTPDIINVYSAAIVAGLAAVGVIAVLLADRAARPVLRHATADLSERE